MKVTARLVVLLAVITVLPACAKVVNRKGPVNTLNYTIPIGESTNPNTNPLLRPPGLVAQPSKNH